MPKRTGRRNPQKSHATLDLLTEMNLVSWEPILIGTGFNSITDLGAAWDCHGDAILTQYVQCLPGTRPAAMYYLGLLPLPETLNPPRAWDTTQKWGEKTYYPRWRYFGTSTGTDDHFLGGCNWGECHHLHGLGVIDAEEYERAREWCDDRFYSPDAPYRRYEPICVE